MADEILITGLRAVGVHGALPEEQVRPQPFEIDVTLRVDLHEAGASDALGDTVDYGEVVEAIQRVVASERYQLLERLATRIGEVCRADDRVTGVTVTVRKLRPPVPALLEHVAVRVER